MGEQEELDQQDGGNRLGGSRYSYEGEYWVVAYQTEKDICRIGERLLWDYIALGRMDTEPLLYLFSKRCID